MSCRCPACNPMIRARPEWEEPCKLTHKERILKQRKERYRESQAFVQANGARYEAHRERILAERKTANNIADSVSSAAKPPKINPKNMYWPPYDPSAPEGEKHIEIEYINEIISIAVLSLEEAEEFYENLGGKSTLGSIKDYGGLAKGTAEAYATAKGLGGLGVISYSKNINGKDWIIIKNFRRHLKTLEKGIKWSANNPKIVQMGLGLNDLKGAVRYVKFNAGIEIAFAIGINAADYIMRDEATLSEFVGNSAGDLVKGFISLAGAAVLTAAFVPATAGVLVVGTIFAFISFAIGKGVNTFDNENGYSKEITEAVRKYLE